MRKSGPIDDPREKPKTQGSVQSGRLTCRDAGKESLRGKWVNPIFGFFTTIRSGSTNAREIREIGHKNGFFS
jgi:hypothetical protein